ncbi:hypothetical protein GCM10029964_107870 [Kibdelosporangium lantanae]
MVTPEVTFADLSRDPHEVAHQVYDSPTESVLVRTRSQEEDDLVLLTARHAEDINTAASAMTRLLVGLTPEALFGVLPHAFPWVRYLPVEDQRAFAASLVSVLREAESADNPALVVQRIVEWRHTAEIHADPRLLAILQQDGQDLGEVPRP